MDGCLYSLCWICLEQKVLQKSAVFICDISGVFLAWKDIAVS